MQARYLRMRILNVRQIIRSLLHCVFRWHPAAQRWLLAAVVKLYLVKLLEVRCKKAEQC